jgi:hypothetical protein
MEQVKRERDWCEEDFSGLHSGGKVQKVTKTKEITYDLIDLTGMDELDSQAEVPMVVDDVEIGGDVRTDNKSSGKYDLTIQLCSMNPKKEGETVFLGMTTPLITLHTKVAFDEDVIEPYSDCPSMKVKHLMKLIAQEIGSLALASKLSNEGDEGATYGNLKVSKGFHWVSD